MALLGTLGRTIDRWGRTGVRLLLAGSLVALAGCFLLEAVGLRETELAFSHRVHVEDQGLDCTDCHTGAEDSDEPGMPGLGSCMLCHEELDAEKPESRRVASLYEGGVWARKERSALPGEVLFSHATHVELGGDCASCHGAIETTDAIEDEVQVSMDDCIRCHAAVGVAAECATCHTEVRADRPPATHGGDWSEFHGQVVRARSEDTVDRCAMCHTESSCTTCHQTEPPRDHTGFWRRRGHSFVAALERDRCAACHEEDSCNRCHAEALPLTHTGSFGGVQSNHCFSCHFPLRAEGCFTCHKETPSHLLAPPKPPNHFPGMDCRQCHGLTAPLPHADNGTDCNFCHA